MAHIEVRVINQFGTFEGLMEMEPGATFDDATEAVDGFVQIINNVDRLALVTPSGEKIIFNKIVLQQSVLSLRAIE